MESSRLHDRRSFARARDGLVAKGLLHVEAGGRGPGNRSLYRLPLDTEMRAPERANAESARTSAQTPDQQPQMRAQKRASERARSKQGNYTPALGLKAASELQRITDTSRSRENKDDGYLDSRIAEDFGGDRGAYQDRLVASTDRLVALVREGRQSAA